MVALSYGQEEALHQRCVIIIIGITILNIR